jgi:hypothetical protein
MIGLGQGFKVQRFWVLGSKFRTDKGVRCQEGKSGNPKPYETSWNDD